MSDEYDAVDKGDSQVLEDVRNILDGSKKPDEQMKVINGMIRDDKTGDMQSIVLNIFRARGCHNPQKTLGFLRAAVPAT